MNESPVVRACKEALHQLTYALEMHRLEAHAGHQHLSCRLCELCEEAIEITHELLRAIKNT